MTQLAIATTSAISGRPSLRRGPPRLVKLWAAGLPGGVGACLSCRPSCDVSAEVAS